MKYKIEGIESEPEKEATLSLVRAGNEIYVKAVFGAGSCNIVAFQVDGKLRLCTGIYTRMGFQTTGNDHIKVSTD